MWQQPQEIKLQHAFFSFQQYACKEKSQQENKSHNIRNDDLRIFGQKAYEKSYRKCIRS